jgi:hypothetical protein
MVRGDRAGAVTGTGGVEDLTQAVRDLVTEARATVSRLAGELEVERRVRERPLVALGVAAVAGFALGGGLWPVLRPFAKAALRTAFAPANLLAIGAALGAMRSASAREGEPHEPAPPETH